MKSIAIILLSFLFTSVSLSNTKETRIKVAVVDTGVHKLMAKESFMCKDGVKDFSGVGGYDIHGHGTNIIGIIAEKINPSTHCIVSINFLNQNSSGHQNLTNLINALVFLNKDKNVKYINLSLGGPLPNMSEKSAIKKLLTKGVVIVAAAGNDGKNMDTPNYKYYPASYRETLKYSNFHVIASELPSSNSGKVVTETYSGTGVKPKFWYSQRFSGTSQAAAQKMADILKNVVLYNTGDQNGKQKSNRRTKCY